MIEIAAISVCTFLTPHTGVDPEWRRGEDGRLGAPAREREQAHPVRERARPQLLRVQHANGAHRDGQGQFCAIRFQNKRRDLVESPSVSQLFRKSFILLIYQ